MSNANDLQNQPLTQDEIDAWIADRVQYLTERWKDTPEAAAAAARRDLQSSLDNPALGVDSIRYRLAILRSDQKTAYFLGLPRSPERIAIGQRWRDAGTIRVKDR